MANPTVRPWVIKPAANSVSAPSIVSAVDQSTIVSFKAPESTTGLVGGLLTQVLTTLGGQQSELNDANARYLTRAVNTMDRTAGILQAVRMALDPSLNRVLGRDQFRKQLYQQVEELLAEIQRPL